MPDSITLMFFISVGIGIILIIFSLILNKKQNTNSDLSQSDLITEKQNNLLKIIEDADDAIEQLNGISKSIFEQQEEKYQELLYLYQIIDEKKEELSEIWEKTISLETLENISTKNNSSEILNNKNNIETANNFVASNPHYNEIVTLHNKGVTITQIAKQLNIGQGEVSLVLELRRRGG